MRKQPILEKIYAVSETEYIDEKKTTTKTTGYTFAIGSTSGEEYLIGTNKETGEWRHKNSRFGAFTIKEYT